MKTQNQAGLKIKSATFTQLEKPKIKVPFKFDPQLALIRMDVLMDSIYTKSLYEASSICCSIAQLLTGNPHMQKEFNACWNIHVGATILANLAHSVANDHSRFGFAPGEFSTFQAYQWFKASFKKICLMPFPEAFEELESMHYFLSQDRYFKEEAEAMKMMLDAYVFLDTIKDEAAAL